MRKEVRGFRVGAASDVIDRRLGHAGIPELERNEPREITVRLAAPTLDDRPPTGRAFHLDRDIFADLERAHPDVRTNRCDDLAGIVRQRCDRSWNDPRNRTSPTGMNGCDMSGRGMPEKNRHAVGSTRRDAEPRIPRHERIPFGIRDRARRVRVGYLEHEAPMDLALLVEPIDIESEARCKARAILHHGSIVIAEMKTEVERVERRRADASRPRRKRVPETMTVEKGRTENPHRETLSTPCLHEPRCRAKTPVLQARARSGLCIDFLPWNGQTR